MPSLGAPLGERLSTDAFYEELTRVDFSGEGSRIRTYSIDLDPVAFVGALSLSGVLEPIASKDGVVSHVQEKPTGAKGDNSASSHYFSLHTDGTYLSKVPEMVVLHCVDPGTSEIPTVFVNTQDIMDTLQSRDRMEEAKGYDFIFRSREGVDFIRPLIDTSPVDGKPVMNIAVGSAQCHLRPQGDSDKTQEDANNFYDLLEEIVAEDIPTLVHTWRENDAVVFDNLLLIHGRGLQEHKDLKTSDSKRYLHRIWLNRKPA